MPIREREDRRLGLIVFAGLAFFAGFASIFELAANTFVFVDFFVAFRLVDFLTCFELGTLFLAIIHVP
jgi:hypothetical protein